MPLDKVHVAVLISQPKTLKHRDWQQISFAFLQIGLESGRRLKVHQKLEKL